PTVPRVHGGELIDTWTGWTTPGAGRQPRASWPEPAVLETARLRLRPWRAGDSRVLVEASADMQLRHFIPHSPLPRDVGAVPAYLDRIRLAEANGDRLAWCVADRESDAALGNVALFEFDGSPDELTAQVGYWAHPAARGRGVMAEAVRRVADWCLDPEPAGLGARRLYLLTAASNRASRRVAEACGFEHVGTERLGGPVGNGYEDSALYDRLREA
ncbi:MAG TPA: GNAT family protein, partial [Pedococcus sp.]|nr:GNAT family protein [Pedococcus sp.]